MQRTPLTCKYVERGGEYFHLSLMRFIEKGVAQYYQSFKRLRIDKVYEKNNNNNIYFVI